MKIVIETIPHEKQRYPTVGDWVCEKEWPAGEMPTGGKVISQQEVLRIKVSDLGDWRKEALIAVHELIEVLICKHDGVSQEAVDKFDFEFEEKRKVGLECSPDDAETARLETLEPGDDNDAPYRRQHCIATGIERLLAAELDVSWKEYEDAIYQLP